MPFWTRSGTSSTAERGRTRQKGLGKDGQRQTLKESVEDRGGGGKWSEGDCLLALLRWLFGMTPEERFEHIEQVIVQIVDIQREQAEVQRDQARIVRNHAQTLLEVTEKLDALIDVVDKLIKRNGH